ncbi:MAG TPA: hypothetical protein PKE04_00805 [Clostridia bacterium]|nr:hypothetical protein [Clostridia bacterium]
MKKIDATSFEEIRKWIYRNARPLELALWQYEFENGGKEAVLSALSHYQNEDGGFGHALEPDNWNPNSSPAVTLNAIGKLSNIRFEDAGHPIIQGLIRYLESGAHFVGDGWVFTIPSNNDCPRAPWWSYDPKASAQAHIGVTLGLACFVLRFAKKESDLYRQAFALVLQALSKLKESDAAGDMGLNGYCALLETLDQLGLSDSFDMEFLYAAVKKLVDEAIVRDVSRWAHYVARPSQFITAPESPFYKGNEDIVQKELDYLVETRPENGVWGISWHWYGNTEKYPKEFAISENWWKADLDIGAVGKLKFLRRFGRL